MIFSKLGWLWHKPFPTTTWTHAELFFSYQRNSGIHWGIPSGIDHIWYLRLGNFAGRFEVSPVMEFGNAHLRDVKSSPSTLAQVLADVKSREYRASYVSKLMLRPNLAYSSTLRPSISSLITLSLSSNADASVSIFSEDVDSNSWTSGKGSDMKESPIWYLWRLISHVWESFFAQITRIRYHCLVVRELKFVGHVVQILFFLL